MHVTKLVLERSKAITYYKKYVLEDMLQKAEEDRAEADRQLNEVLEKLGLGVLTDVQAE